MKKLLLITILITTFISCSNDDDTSKLTIEYKDIVDTNWIAVVGGKTHSIHFEENSICKYTKPSDGDDSQHEIFVCKIEKGNILLLFNNENVMISKGYFKDDLLYLDLIKGLYYPFKKVE